jgi:dipeptidyl-peptidase-4
VVTDSVVPFVLNQWLADRAGAIVVSIDARGTPNRGHDWERALIGKLGSVPLEGHIASLKALGARFPEMDTTRIGVYGWSFGGYFAAMAVLARPDVYKVGVAAAPPADWRDYDTAYTERYLGLPSAEAAAYDAASLLTMAAAPRPAASARLLLVHGTADDNVYFFHSLKLAGALEKAGRPFEMFPVPGMTHVPREPESLEAVFRNAGDFLKAHL